MVQTRERATRMCSFFQQRQARARAEREGAAPFPAAGSDTELRVIRPSVAAETLTAEGASMRHWSLLPFWAKEPKLKFSTFNARAETLTEKPAFREAWKRGQRCLIPAVSYSEWLSEGGRKIRQNIVRADGEELMIAGLWSDWQRGDQARDTFTMITTSALESIAWVHARSPLMLTREHWDQWLTGAADDCRALLRPLDPGELLVRPAND